MVNFTKTKLVENVVSCRQVAVIHFIVFTLFHQQQKNKQPQKTNLKMWNFLHLDFMKKKSAV